MMTIRVQISSTRWSRCDETSTATPRPAQADDRLLHAMDAERVEAGQRLVEHQRLRIVDERARERDLLLHPARQLRRERRLASP